MTSVPPGEGAPGWMGPAPKIHANGTPHEFSGSFADFRHPDDPGPGTDDIPPTPSLSDANDVEEFYGSDAVRSAFEEAQRPRGLPLVDISLWTGNPPPRRSLWGQMLPACQTTMLTGAGGVGKSLFAQALATHVALGREFLGQTTEMQSALYITCEDDEAELWRRQEAICEAMGVPLQAVIGKLHLCSLTGAADTALATFDEHGRIHPTDRWAQMAETCEDSSVGLFVFDNATDAMAGDLNDIHEVAEFVNLLTGLAIRCDGAALLVHHPNKAGDEWLGSVAWHNKVRSRLIITRGENEDDPDSRTITAPKANYGPSGGKIDFRWHAGTFVRDEDLPSDYAAELASSIKVTAENEAFLRCLRAANERRQAVSHTPGTNYYATIFPRMAEARKLKKDAFERAFQRLLSTGAIELDCRLWQRENRAWKYGIKAVDKPV